MNTLSQLADRAPRPFPRTPTGRRIAAALIVAGVVTGVAIVVDPFDDDSGVVVETRRPEDPPAGPSTGDDDDDVVDTSGGSTDDRVDEAPTHVAPADSDHELGGTHVAPADSGGTSSETVVIIENGAGSDELVDEEYEWLNHECFALLDAYPDIEGFDPTIADRCVSDPAAALVVAVDLAAEIDELEAYSIAVDACYAELEAWSFLVDIDPMLVDGCHQDPEATLVVIDQYLDVRD